MSWDSYIGNLMGKDGVMDAAIVGHEIGSESVWSAYKGEGSKLQGVTVAEIKVLVAKDRSTMFSGGASLAGTKCTVLRDTLFVDNAFTMDMRTKADANDENTYSICIGKSEKALVIVKAKKDVHGGVVNKIAFEMADYLRKAGY